jgi:hypothetical protein
LIETKNKSINPIINDGKIVDERESAEVKGIRKTYKNNNFSIMRSIVFIDV